MSPFSCPCLRPGLAASRDGRSSDFVYLHDTWRQSPRPLRLSMAEFGLLERINGQNDVASLALPVSGGSAMVHLLARLEDGLFLRVPIGRPDWPLPSVSRVVWEPPPPRPKRCAAAP